MRLTIYEDEIENKWIYEEFKNLAINCGRTINRFIKTMITLSKNPDESIAAASKDKAEAKAIYRLLQNEKLTEEVILSTHKKQTIKNIKESGESVVLCIQDTSDINYTSLKATTGLGDYGAKKNSKGLIVHSTIAVTPNGVMKGILDQKIWARDPAERGKRRTRHQRPIEEKESFKWLESMDQSNKDIPAEIKVINVCDREADLFEFFHKAIKEDRFFLVRATYNRLILNDECKSFDKVHNEKVAGELTVEIPRDTRRKIPKRNATIELKYTKVVMPVPPKIRKYFGKEDCVEVFLILAKEKNVPAGIEPIQWYLATNVETSSVDEAIEKVRWYIQRWKIERFHYILKSGCKIEELQEKDATRLKKLILMYSIIAFRILCMTYLARENPESSCETMLQEEEWKVLYRIANKTSDFPEKAPTIKEAVDYVAKLGGFLGRKGDGDPGVKVIWRGLKKLNVVLQYYKHLIPNNGNIVGQA
jgi:Transposase Tn5 dimerisation domain/Transposase DNA-binding